MTVGSNLEKADTKRTQNPSNRISRYSSLIRRPTTGQNFDHPFAHVQTSPDNIVGFDGEDDPYNPKNWPLKKKMATTALYGLATMGSTWASSVYASGAQQISDEFHVGRPVSQLGKTLFLVGYGLGAMIWAPVSEVFGRITATLPPYLIAAIFSFGTATAKDIQTVIITRFFTGFFSAGPMANNGGVLADIWTPANRAKAMVGYSLAVAAGPSLGPIAGGAIIQGGLRWRWTEYVTGSFMMLLWTLDVLILDESYAPRLLVYKARRLRLQTGNWALHAQFEEWDVSVKELALKFGMRPLQMLCTPICFLFALYASFCYGILYANLSSFPILFQEERGWNHAVGALPFLAVFIGLLVGGVINVTNQGYYMKRLRANNGKPVPEARLPPMMYYQPPD
ncbi:MAG: hypothetical protein LQ342_003195 [Letrouitia transgressa]|nr:MAG: hypothetical protein LQ342_003195 [Letrouitia transgressa]